MSEEKKLQQGADRWRAETRENAGKHIPRAERFFNSSGIEIHDLYLPTDLNAQAYLDQIGLPGQYPFTRGTQPTMYRGRLWTMRQYAGFTSAQETNRRLRYLLEHGQTGLSIAFDLPTQMGYDSDDPLAEGEVGKVGVPISTLDDMETLLDGIPLDKVSTSMTINATAGILVAFYVAVARRRGIAPESLRGTVQNDILKEFIARGLFRYPVPASMRLATDLLAYCGSAMPKWNAISISGYHIREAGSTAAQEIAFTLANGIAYMEAAKARGMDLVALGKRTSFFFNAHNDLFEEIAKFRAARRMWAHIMTERFGVTDNRARMLRFHTQTAGSTLTAQQPDNNVVRVTLQALAAVLGGTQSLHTNSRDEALGLPTQTSATIALRTQQILAHESGIASTIDPLGGSPYVESLTDALETKAQAYIDTIDGMGGALEAIQKGYVKGEINRSSYEYQKKVESGEAVVVGVNLHVDAEEKPPEIFRTDPKVRERRIKSLEKVRKRRDAAKVKALLDNLQDAARGQDNVMPQIVECADRDVTLGEISATLETVFGEETGRDFY